MDALRAVELSHVNAKGALETYQLESRDLERIRIFGLIVTPKLDKYVELFYGWLETPPDFPRFFSDSERLGRVQRMQTA